MRTTSDRARSFLIVDPRARVALLARAHVAHHLLFGRGALSCRRLRCAAGADLRLPETNFPRIVIAVDNGVMPVEQMQVTITKPLRTR